MKNFGIFHGSNSQLTKTVTSGIFRNSKRKNERDYQIFIYQEQDLFKIYKTDNELVLSKLEEMAEEEITKLRERNPSSIYELKYIYKYPQIN